MNLNLKMYQKLELLTLAGGNDAFVPVLGKRGLLFVVSAEPRPVSGEDAHAKDAEDSPMAFVR
jgi:hypothetical protein